MYLAWNTNAIYITAMPVSYLAILLVLMYADGWLTTEQVQQALPDNLCGNGRKWAVKALRVMYESGLCVCMDQGKGKPYLWRKTKLGDRRATTRMDALAELYFDESGNEAGEAARG